MPLNEAKGQSRGLTRAQKEAEMRAIYGLDKAQMSQDFSSEEIERMREILKLHDANKKAGVNEFDLNHPPTKPYAHQDFPMMVYGQNNLKAFAIVHNVNELEAALEDGFSRKPVVAQAEPESELDAELAAETEQIDQQIAKASRKPGRPKKVVEE